MKKTILLNLLFLVSVISWSQPFVYSGVIYDQETHETLPFVNVTINNTRVGLAADVDGSFEIRSDQPITQLSFSFIGYQKLDMPVTASTPVKLEIFMAEATNTLREVDVTAGENPAFRIIRKVIANKDKNHPDHLESYKYTSYNKLLVTIQADSMPPLFDTSFVAMEDTSYSKVDSSGYELQQFMDSQHIFIMESVTEKTYKSPGSSEEKVLATRTAGINQPLFVLVSSQVLSFSFYDDFISILGKDFLNPLSDGALSRYVYLINDTIYQGSDTVFVIEYFPVKNPKIPSMNGVLYINSDGYALQNVTAEPFEKEGIGITVQQKYEKVEGAWFPQQLNYDFRIYGVSVYEAQPVGIGRTYIKNIEINPEVNTRDFAKADIILVDSSLTKDQAYWNKLRGDSLDSKELRTYEFIDSIGEEFELDAQIEKLQVLLEGRYPYKFMEFPFDKVLSYNIYEGLRLGFGVETNDKLIKGVRLKGYLGYGFSDEVFKYGYGAEIMLNRRWDWVVGGGYSFDLQETGRTKNHLEDKPNLLSNNTRFFWIEQFDQVSRFELYTQTDLTPNLRFHGQFTRDNRWVNGDYRYRTESAEGIVTEANGFNFSSVMMGLRWSPKDEIMETPLGRRNLTKGTPVFYLDAEQGFAIEDLGDYDYSRIQAAIDYRIKTVSLGESQWILRGGYVDPSVPLSKLFYPSANVPSREYLSITTSSTGSFEAMRNNEFLADRYLSLAFRQNFFQRWGKPWGMEWDLEFVAAAYFGWLSQPENHQGVFIQSGEEGYYETGLEMNKMWNGLGIGVYRRFGPYTLPVELDNWAFKLSYRFDLF